VLRVAKNLEHRRMINLSIVVVNATMPGGKLVHWPIALCVGSHLGRRRKENVVPRVAQIGYER
jgi:hypothetical protein